MGGALRKSLVYLGLAEDGQEETYDGGYAPQPNAGYHAPEPAVEYAAPVTPLRPVLQPEYAPVGPDLHRITTIHPRSYNDARLIGEAFRNGVPVIMNLSDMGAEDAKRLVDFSSGLIFGLNGGIERVTPKVFLLSPEHIEVIGEDAVVSEVGGGPEAIGGQFYNQS
ncbi:MAG: cell division protein SepF [Cellulomonadaceae bacterium]|jgi:cell division inhibitor SepF|nr:cell division protein SepF [Cellulomonadaceae bacterium]